MKAFCLTDCSRTTHGYRHILQPVDASQTLVVLYSEWGFRDGAPPDSAPWTESEILCPGSVWIHGNLLELSLKLFMTCLKKEKHSEGQPEENCLDKCKRYTRKKCENGPTMTRVSLIKSYKSKILYCPCDILLIYNQMLHLAAAVAAHESQKS